jgi:uncharacterized protein (DUF2336 family)
VSSSDFRQITIKGEALKAERLFRAAVSAFCSLTRPSRREIAQLEDLTLPLFDLVSVGSRRYVAAALSECQYAPAALVRRLADQTVDIAAPLLIRSNALSDIDLIALIGRHGLAHARAIGRRPGLNPTIANLVAALDRKVVAMRPGNQAPDRGSHRDVQPTAPALPNPAEAEARPHGAAAENARRRLRSMMRPGGPAGNAAQTTFITGSIYSRLRDTALTGNPAFFHTALADSLEADFAIVRGMVGTSSYTGLLAAMRVLDLSDEQAFLIAAAIFPSQFSRPEAIRLFLSRYRLLHRDVALDRIKSWKAESASILAGEQAEASQAQGSGPALEFPIRTSRSK